MSNFSGKCDFADEVDIFGFNTIKNSEVYVSNVGPLKIESQKDLIPYYPYIVGMSYHDNVKKTGVINLSSRSFNDSEEERHVKFQVNTTLKYAAKCKRNKKPFDIDEALKRIALSIPDITDREICNRIKDGKIKNIADFDDTCYDIHDSMHDYYRRQLIEAATKEGMENHPLMVVVKHQIDEFAQMSKKYNEVK